MADDDRLTNPQYVWNQLDYENDALIEASAGTGKTYALESIVLIPKVRPETELMRDMIRAPRVIPARTG